ncbi:MAG: DegV family protein [Anaerolineales bacterium]|nr:DegV family protein [Anaerolineales bacterium]
MGKTVVITDSTAYLPAPLVQQYGIIVVPLTVVWGNETFRDGIDITPPEFYKRLKTAKVMPSTSQTTPDEFKKVFAPIVEAGDSILLALISSKLSGTVDSAVQAKAAFPDAAIEIVDTHTTAMALGFCALAAARAAHGGAGMAESAQAARKAVESSGVVFVVDTLEFLHRGGRIGGAAAFLGTALNMKPLLTLHEGKVEAIAKVRTKGKAVERMLDIIEERIGSRRPLRIGSLQAAAEEEAQALLKTAEQRFQPVESVFSEVSPVIGTHVGPGTIGLAYCAGI